MKKILLALSLFISAFSFGQNVHVPNSTDFINVKTSGADNTGVVDITSMINTLQSTRKTLYFPAGTYKIKELKLLDSVRIIGDDDYTYFKVTTNDTVISCGNFDYISGITFLGNSGTTAQIGINMDNMIGNKVISCHFQSLGTAIRMATSGLLVGYQGHMGNQVEFCDGESNVWGARIDTRGEYNTFVNVKFMGTTNAGFYNAGGNNTFIGCDANNGGTGYELAGGLGNDAHSNVTGSHFNHNTRSLYVHGVVFGYTFSATQFYYGRMELDTSVYLNFTNCDIDCTGDSLIFNKVTLSTFDNCKFFSSPKIGNYSVNQVTNVLTNGTASWNLNDILNNKDFKLTNNNGVVVYGGIIGSPDNSQQNFFYHPIVTTLATYGGTTRDLWCGPADFRYNSATLADPFQFYVGSTAHRVELSLLDKDANYLMRSWNDGQIVWNQRPGTTVSSQMEMGVGSPVAGFGTMKIPYQYSTTSAASGTGVTATITLTTSNLGFKVGQTVVISGITPSGYNGTYILTGATTSTVSYANATTGAQTVAGVVESGKLATPESGAIERDKDHLYFTDATNTRFQLDQQTAGSATSGTYTPTLTNTTNVSGSAAAVTTYMQIGNEVTVSMPVSGLTPTTGGGASTVLTFTLPVSTATTTQNSVGTGFYYNGPDMGIVNIVSATTGTLTWFSHATTGSVANIQFMYKTN